MSLLRTATEMSPERKKLLLWGLRDAVRSYKQARRKADAAERVAVRLHDEMSDVVVYLRKLGFTDEDILPILREEQT